MPFYFGEPGERHKWVVGPLSPLFSRSNAKKLHEIAINGQKTELQHEDSPSTASPEVYLNRVMF